MPERIAKKPRRACQIDLDARWAQKGDTSYYGYNNHIKMDAASKFIETFTVTDAAVHDSQPVEELLREIRAVTASGASASNDVVSRPR